MPDAPVVSTWRGSGPGLLLPLIVGTGGLHRSVLTGSVGRRRASNDRRRKGSSVDFLVGMGFGCGLGIFLGVTYTLRNVTKRMQGMVAAYEEIQSGWKEMLRDGLVVGYAHGWNNRDAGLNLPVGAVTDWADAVVANLPINEGAE